MKTTTNVSKGTVGEQIIAEFFDSQFSKFFTFPNPRTKDAEVADLIVWENQTVFLIEVKTRDEGVASLESWASLRIQQAVIQITRNHQRIINKERITLHNNYYQTELDCEEIYRVIGIVILVYDGQCNILPSNAEKEVYSKEIPIHVFSWKDISRMVNEIDTIPDLKYYLNDRFEYLKIGDIPLDVELNALGYYKTQSNKFPNTAVDFIGLPYWETYITSMAEKIKNRDTKNQASIWLDKLELNFSEQRKLFHGLPLGLYFAWEIGSISRSERAIVGEKLDSVQSYFEKGNTNRKFAFFNGSTGNWLVFYFSKSKQHLLQEELNRLVELKLIKEIQISSFDSATYGFGFQVSITYPPRFLGLSSAIVIGADVVKGKYSESDIEDSYKEFGDITTRSVYEIKEFPEE